MKKRIFSLLTVLVLCLGLLPGAALAEEAPGGASWTDGLTEAPDGFTEEGDTITVTTPEALAWLAVLVNSEEVTAFENNPTYGKTVVLGADLDLGGKNWVPIGGEKMANALLGSFDGNGHTISNMTIDSRDGDTHIGLLGKVHFCDAGGPHSIQNVTVENASITTNHFDKRSYVGVLAGEIIGEGTVSGCTASGTIRCDEACINIYAGGLIGTLNPTIGSDRIYLRADRCFADVDITGSPMYAGGFAGYLESCGEIINCGAAGDVVMTDPYADYPSAGGFIGSFETSNGKVNIENCYAAGDVGLHSSSSKTQFVYAGGFAGCIDSYEDTPVSIEGCIKGCMSSGNVTVSASASESPMAGGFIGNGGKDPVLSITDSYSTGDVEAENGVYVLGGGFVGYGAITAEDCYSLGSVTSRNGSTYAWAFGFSAWTMAGASFTNCYALGEAMDGGTHATTFLNGDYASGCCYYEGMTLAGTDASNKTVTALSVDEILDGSAFSGFDSGVWQLSAGGIPILAGIPDDVEKTDKPSYLMVTVTFDSQDGSEVSPVRVRGGSRLTKPADPEKEGFDFGGWYKEAECENQWDFETDTVAGDLTLYAKWTEKSVDPGPGPGPGPDPGPGPTPPPTPSQPSGGGSGWEDDDDDDDDDPPPSAPATTTTSTVKNPDGSTTTTASNRKTGAVTTVTKAPDGTSVTVTTDQNGRVTSAEASVPKGTKTATLPVKWERDTELKITVKGGGAAEVTIPAEGVTPGTVAVVTAPDGSQRVDRKSIVTADGVVLTVRGSAAVRLEDRGRTFPDVPAGGWKADAAAFTSARGILNGGTDGRFRPESPMTRAMLAVVLHNLEGNPAPGAPAAFADVPQDAWYAEAVAWASAEGVVTGYTDEVFGPDDSITREQLAVMLWRRAGRPAAPDRTLPFIDADQAGEYAREALCWAVERGVMSGRSGGILDPKGIATRSQTAQMLKNYLEKIG